MRGATPTNGKTGKPAIWGDVEIEAEDWYAARVCAARRFALDPFDPAMFATPKVETKRRPKRAV